MMPRSKPTQEQLKKLWDHAVKFVDDQKISCAEAVAQQDEVIINAYEFIEGVAETVGYHQYTEDDQ